jgi:hypothetical protein
LKKTTQCPGLSWKCPGDFQNIFNEVWKPTLGTRNIKMYLRARVVFAPDEKIVDSK